MDPTNRVILETLALLNRPVSIEALLAAVRLKTSIPLAEFEARIAGLSDQGYLRINQAGLASLTQAGAGHLGALRDEPAQPRRRRFQLPRWAVLAGLFLAGILGILLCGTLVFMGWQALSRGRLAAQGRSAPVVASTVVAPYQTAQPARTEPAQSLFAEALASTATLIARPAASPTAEPTLTVPPTLTLSPEPIIVAQSLSQTAGQGRLADFNVSETILMPLIDPPVATTDQDFNQQIQNYVDGVQQSDLEWLEDPLPSPGGFLDIDYAILSTAGWTPGEHFPYLDESMQSVPLETAAFSAGHDVVSVLFSVLRYYGGAHPGTIYTTVNYDLTTGWRLNLDDLFLPATPYLETIAAYCAEDLPRRYDDLFFDGPYSYREGAAAELENYQTWAVTRSGLLVVFGEYQVAPYAAGPKYVIVPYSVLDWMIDPRGPLGQREQ